VSLFFLQTTDCVIPDDAMLGEHILSGVDFTKCAVGQAEVNAMCFVLDGIAYRCVENGDECASALAALEITDYVVQNTFAPRCVVGVKTQPGKFGFDGIVFVDAETDKLVLEFGTDGFDGRCPRYIADFFPENMVCKEK